MINEYYVSRDFNISKLKMLDASGKHSLKNCFKKLRQNP